MPLSLLEGLILTKLQLISAIKSPLVTIYNQQPMRARVESENPGFTATAGRARIPAPTVVPATRAIAETREVEVLGGVGVEADEDIVVDLGEKDVREGWEEEGLTSFFMDGGVEGEDNFGQFHPKADSFRSLSFPLLPLPLCWGKFLDDFNE